MTHVSSSGPLHSGFIIRNPPLRIAATAVGKYNPWLVLISIVVAIVASYVALDLSSRVTAARGRSSALWWLVARWQWARASGPCTSSECRVTARQKRFLVAFVNDDRSLREALGSFLKSAGFRVRAFASAEAFIASGVHISLCCLITDLQLPGSSGFQLHEQLERAQCRVPTIFITGAVDLDGAGETRLTAGAIAFPMKPFDPQELLSAVQSACS